jgi:hypothetical protein
MKADLLKYLYLAERSFEQLIDLLMEFSVDTEKG